MNSDTSGAVIGLLILALIVAVTGVPVLTFGRSRRQRIRDTELARHWEWAINESRGPGVHLALVLEVYQEARRGSKAIIQWQTTGQCQDTWFQHQHGLAGRYVLVTGGSSGWGPHNANPNVFYVAPDTVIGIVSGDAPLAWQRHQQRSAT